MFYFFILMAGSFVIGLSIGSLLFDFLNNKKNENRN